MSDSEYQSWIKTFFEGSFLVDGWNAQVQKLLRTVGVSGDDAEHFATQLQQLGQRIGEEWAKANHIRKIDTDMLKQWGADLQAAAKQGAESLQTSIATIEQTVAQLLEKA